VKPLSRLPATALPLLVAVIGALSCDPGPSSGASDSGASADARAPFDAGSSADSGTSADGGSTHGGGEPVAITGKVSALTVLGAKPLGGATVEIVGVDPAISTITGTDGNYSLAVAPGTYFVRASKNQMVSTQVGVITSQSTVVTELSLLSTSDMDSLARTLELNLDQAKGIVVVGFETSDTGGGYKATLSAPAETSFALPEAGWPPKATESTLAGGENALFFINVMPGTTTLTPTAPSGHSCTEALPMGTYRIDANVATAISATCN
jgi:hypothetical protein